MADQTVIQSSQPFAPLIGRALERLDILLTDFNEIGESGSNSRMIGWNAQMMLDQWRTDFDRTGDISTASVYELGALLDGARSVADARPGGIAILEAAIPFADALAVVISDGGCGPEAVANEVRILETVLACGEVAA